MVLCRLVVLVLVVCNTAFLRAADTKLFTAGAAAVTISPETLPAYQNGGFLTKRSDRILDPLHARALVLCDGDLTIAIVIVDSCMFPTSLCDQIKQLASEKTGIRSDRILISATHTHSAPSTMLTLGCPTDEAYLKYVPDRVAQSIEEAHGRLQPAKLGWTVVNGEDLTNCRRWITRSDRRGTDPFGQLSVRAMMHPGYQNANYTSPAGPTDTGLSVLSVVSANEETPICVMANLSMHYFGGAGFSADYFGEVARLLEAQCTGSDASGFVGIMSQGTSGDLHWMDYSKPRSGISRAQYSEKVAKRIFQSLKKIEYRSDLPLAMAEKRLLIDRRIPSKGRREWARPINAARHNQLPRNQVEVYAQQAEWIHDNPKAEVVLQAVRIGDLGITAIPNEVYGITGLKLKYQSPLETTFNLELANGATGYIPPPEQHRLGGYTTWPARTAGLVEEAEPLIVDTLLGLLESVAHRTRRALVPPTTEYSTVVKNHQPAAYWCLDDMTSTRVKDVVGSSDAAYRGGIALYLPGPDGSGMTPTKGVSRSVYLAGGHIEADVEQRDDASSVSFWFYNALPIDARETTGVLLANGSETLMIAGKGAGEDFGRLMLASGKQTAVGKHRVVTGAWHHLTITRDLAAIRVYLDGNPEPDLIAKTVSSDPINRLLIGSDGDNESTFDGKIDEIAFFQRALQPDEIVVLYKASGAIPPPQPKPTEILGPKPQDDDARARYRDVVLASQPLAFWRLHDESDSMARDTTGQHTANYEAGAGPLKKNGSNPNFSGGRVNAKIPDLDDTYSIELWFRNELPVDSRPVTAYLFSRAIDGVEGASGDNLGLGGTHSHQGKLIVFNGNERDQLVAGTTLIPRGSWAHVVMVRQGQRVTVYLNGDTEAEISAELPIAWPVTCEDLLVGGRSDKFANLVGMLEEIAVYDRALKPIEVKDHFEAAGVKTGFDLDTVKEPVSKPQPTDVGNALETIHVPQGFQVDLVAAEPMVMDPVAIDWGPDGKLWVIEMADYPLGIDGKGKPGGRLRFLEDTDQDGRYDKSTLFAEGLSFPTGILVWGDGVLVTAAPEIVYLEDTSGDGKADIRKTLYSGFLEGNQQLRVNGLRWGLDNWVYCASGSHHSGYGKDSQIVSHLNSSRHAVGSRDFRIQPDIGAIDPQSGPSQYGRNRDDWGNWFGVQNSHPLWHYVLADQNIRRNPFFAPPDPKNQVITPANPRVYPASQPQKRYHSFSQSGRFTSACSAMIYRDELLFDRSADQHAFTCEPFHNLVQHNLITDEGVSFRFRREPAESKLDFFASEDRWCRPVMARTGPDGGLWVVDMYRYMIEHPQWLPQQGKDELMPWYREGHNRGRIYRITRNDRPARKVSHFVDLDLPNLVALLDSPNGWQRDTVQRMLVRGNRQAAIEPLKQLFSKSEHALTRLHSLWTLDGLGALSSDILEAALSDQHAGVRRNAVRLAAVHSVDDTKLMNLVDDPDAKVRLELASTLGSHEGSAAASTLAKLLHQDGEDPYMVASVMSSLNQQNVVPVLVASMQLTDFGNRDRSVHSFNRELIGQTVAMIEQTELGEVIDTVFREMDRLPQHERFRVIATLLDAMESRKISRERLPKRANEQIASATLLARKTASDQGLADEVRSNSIELLGRDSASQEGDFNLMQDLLVPQTPVVVQQAVVAHFSRYRQPAIAERLLSGWRSHSPELRSRILDVLTTRDSWTEAIRRHLESKDLLVSEISASVRQRLLSQSKQSEQWNNAFSIKVSSDRGDVLSRYRVALEMKGDRNRGEAVFRKSCINCHKLGNEGHAVGPELASITNKTKEALLTSILDPSAAVDTKYFSYSIVTDDGRVLAGQLQTETGSSITLLAAGGKQETVLRRNIDELRASTKSLMPEGLEQELTPQQVADLILFVRESFR